MGCQHANTWSAFSPSSGGSSTRHWSVALAQRGANRQPTGGLVRSGGRPGMLWRRWRLSCSRRGIDAEQRLRIRVTHLVKEQLRGGFFDDFARVHHHDPVRASCDDTHVVGDEDDRHAKLLLQITEQFKDLGLDRDVQSGRRLVRDQQFGIARECHRDHHALAHSTRELVGKVVQTLLGARESDEAEHLNCTVKRLLLADPAVDEDRLGDLVTDALGRVKRGHGVLEDHGDVVATNLLHLLVRELREVLAHEVDAAARDVPPGRQKLQDRQSRHRLAATRLADDAERLACFDVQTHAAYGRDGGMTHINFDGQVLDIQNATHELSCSSPHRCPPVSRPL